jgi:glutamine synthetase
MTRPELTLDQLRAEIADGTIDTVVVAFTDMQGRLQGKRMHGQWFVDTSWARHRGLQLPAHRRRRDEHR